MRCLVVIYSSSSGVQISRSKFNTIMSNAYLYIANANRYHKNLPTRTRDAQQKVSPELSLTLMVSAMSSAYFVIDQTGCNSD